MQSFDTTGESLRLITTAVAPIVMVSATAILISVVNTRYNAISDRVRMLAHEYRNEGTSPARRNLIRQQMLIFHLRSHLVSWAVRLLFLGVGCFISVALMISLSLWSRFLERITPLIFLTGLCLVAVAIGLVFLELQESNRTLRLESSDVIRDDLGSNLEKS